MNRRLIDCQFLDDREKNLEDLLSTYHLEKKNYFCSCWCSQWAEIMIRQPTGNLNFFHNNSFVAHYKFSLVSRHRTSKLGAGAPQHQGKYCSVQTLQKCPFRSFNFASLGF